MSDDHLARKYSSNLGAHTFSFLVRFFADVGQDQQRDVGFCRDCGRLWSTSENLLCEELLLRSHDLILSEICAHHEPVRVGSKTSEFEAFDGVSGDRHCPSLCRNSIRGCRPLLQRQFDSLRAVLDLPDRYLDSMREVNALTHHDSYVEHLARVVQFAAMRPFLSDSEVDVSCVYMLEHALDDRVSAKWADDKQLGRSTAVPCCHDEVSQSADVVEVVMRDEDGIKILHADASRGQLCRDASSCVEK